MFLSLLYAILHGVNPEYHHLSFPCRECPKSLTPRCGKIKVGESAQERKGRKGNKEKNVYKNQKFYSGLDQHLICYLRRIAASRHIRSLSLIRTHDSQTEIGHF